jgi:hypothetical protein
VSVPRVRVAAGDGKTSACHSETLAVSACAIASHCGWLQLLRGCRDAAMDAEHELSK